MRKRALILLFVAGLTLCGCGQNGDLAVGQENASEETRNGNGEMRETEGISGEPEVGTGSFAGDGGQAPDSENSRGKEGSPAPAEGAGAGKTGNMTLTDRGGEAGESGETADGFAIGETAVQGGPYGKLSVTLPAGWKYELCPMDSDSLMAGQYGILFCPDGREEGYIELCYAGSFGVCGTGLEQSEITLAGVSAGKGVYDGHAYWDFICFRESLEDIVALTYGVEEWWSEYEDEVTRILETVSFDRESREGGACVYREESDDSRIGLYFYLEEISAAGATLCYSQYDEQAPTGRLEDGEDFVIEAAKDGRWETVPVVVEGEYGFKDVSYTIPAGEVTKRKLDWKWLYGELAPGEYRIRKSVLDFRKTADYDKYEICAYFILN